MIWEWVQIYRFVNKTYIIILHILIIFNVWQDMLGADQAYEGLYGQGPGSVHSSHGGRPFQQGMLLYIKNMSFLYEFIQIT